MNDGKYDTICCKRRFCLLICSELSCIDPGNQLLIINMNIITILQPSNFNVSLHGYFLQCRLERVIYKSYLISWDNIFDENVK